MASSDPLRVAVIVPQPAPRWAVAALRELETMACVVVHSQPGAGSRTGSIDALDRRFAGNDPGATTPEAIEIVPGAWPAAAEVDAVFCLGVSPAPAAPACRLGTWVVRWPGDDGRAGTVGGVDVQDVWLQRLDADGVLRRTSVRTHRLSPAVTRRRLLWRAARLPARGLADLLAGVHVPAPVEEADAASGSASGGWIRLAARGVRTAVRRSTRRNGWYLGLQIDPPDAPPESAGDVINMIPDRGFWADPFPVAIDDERGLVYVEEWDDALGRGRISALEVFRDGRWSSLGAALEEAVHLSHPYLFDWQDETWMVPETSGRSTVELYRRRGDDPLSWEKTDLLFDGVRMVDVTIQPIDGRWWLFANVADEQISAHEELHLFHADSPLGPWLAHPRNPVVADPRCARPAGQLFTMGGDLVRPAQDCAERYGRALVLHRVETLTTTSYAEAPLRRIAPEPFGANRLHTLNTDRWLRVIDLHRDRRRWP